MALETAEITYDMSDLLGQEFWRGSAKASITVQTNIPTDTIVDTTGNQIRMGGAVQNIGQAGTGTLTVWAPGAGSNPASWQTSFVVSFPDPSSRTGRNTRTFGPYTITEDSTLGSLIKEQEIPPTYLSQVTGALGEFVTDAEAAQAAAVAARLAAEAARDQAVDLSNIDTSDGVMAAVQADPESQFSIDQKATIETALDPIRTVVNELIGRVGGSQAAWYKLRAGEPISITYIGDSILEGKTVDGGVAGVNDAAVLVNSELTAAFGSTVTTHNRAVSGYTAARGVADLLPAAIADASDLYVIGFGHNDLASYSTTPGYGYPVTPFKAAFEHMVRRIRADVPTAAIFLLIENPVYPSADTRNVALADYNAAITDVADTYGCELVDAYASFEGHPSWASGGLMKDGDHPNTAGHAVLADTLLAPMIDAVMPAALTTPVPARDYGSERYSADAWESTSTHTLTPNGTGPSFMHIGTWTGSGPYVSSTVGSYIAGQFIGTEAHLRMTCGSGAATVKIEVDGDTIHASVNLAAYPSGSRYIPITGLSDGPHNIKVTIISGTLTFHELRGLESPHEWIDATSGTVTKAGTFTTNTDALFYGGVRTQTTTVGDTLTCPFTGTGVAVQIYQRSNLDHYIEVSIDGGAYSNVLIRNGASGVGGHVLTTGLTHGAHTVAVRMHSSYTLMWVGGFAELDSTLAP